uniref:RNA-directed DNA polymerase from mobile element jockey-like n=1 Tax=Saccoglossus kowalevskii TaxID=10224 RepID=A0ABM0MX61_SACKO|nr:PREDICTED: RNA-directed DNA polymerase from mobile element jockey-like [Saccoglossus kowalevskii]
MILNDRINQYLHDNDIIHKNQAGFRKKHRTDHILTLHTMVKKYHSMNKPLYCSFIDLKKCFDTVWRSGLLYKLQANCINGRLYNIIKSMYNNIKFYVELDDKMTPAFQTDNGVKQGCPLSPTLFSLFINDLVELLDSTAIDQPVLDGLTISSLLFADDIVITSTSKEGLQSSINHLHDYTNKLGLKVNTDKSKVIFFTKYGHRSDNIALKYGDTILEKNNQFTYLGITFNTNGSLHKTMQRLTDKARKTKYSIGNIYSEKITILS